MVVSTPLWDRRGESEGPAPAHGDATATATATEPTLEATDPTSTQRTATAHQTAATSTQTAATSSQTAATSSQTAPKDNQKFRDSLYARTRAKAVRITVFEYLECLPSVRAVQWHGTMLQWMGHEALNRRVVEAVRAGDEKRVRFLVDLGVLTAYTDEVSGVVYM